MTLPVEINPLLLGRTAGYQISRSVRLRSSASAYFSRTLGSGSQTTWTFSTWFKRGDIANQQVLLSCGTGATDCYLNFPAGGTISIGLNGTVYRATTQVLRDPSAYYHLIFVLDTTNATAQNRARLYINGVEVTAWGTNAAITQNATFAFNSAVAHNLGRYASGASLYVDGYITEVNFIDGQALTPSSFGETDVITGVWKPKKYAGTYGTNGFYLNFSDNSAATAAAIGKDYSGNGNNWTPNNISVTAGATYDSMLDVPTQWADGGNGRGNYATLNPINTLTAGATVSGGNLNIVGASASAYSSPATMLLTSGKWYFEVVAGTVASRYPVVGVQTELTAFLSSGFPGGYTANGFGYGSDGNKYVNNGAAAAFGSTFTSGDVIGVAIDIDAGKVWLSKNNTWQASGDPVAGTNAAYTVTAGTALYPCVGTYNGAGTHSANFGQRPFTYTPPSGFKALNTLNLPTPTILKGNQYFDVSLWTGTGSTQSIVNSGGMQPDLVWVKDRSFAASSNLLDSVRGPRIHLESNTTNAETTESAGVGLTSFNSNGFSLGTDNAGAGRVNFNGDTFVGWQWKKGATQGFDIQAITAQASGSATFSHSLGVAPAMYIVKPRANVGGWNVYHQSLGANKVLALNGTGAAATSTTTWNNTAPTSSVFSLGTDYAGFGTQIVYLFAEVAGFSKFGSYTGNGSADGPFVYCGFRPRFVIIKKTSDISSWTMLDSSRSPSNVVDKYLYADTSSAEATFTFEDFLSNGFKLRTTDSSVNTSGGTYIFAAFAENPFKNSLAR